MPLREALLTTLIWVMLIVASAAGVFCGELCEAQSAQDPPSVSVERPGDGLPGSDTASYEGRKVREIMFPNVLNEKDRKEFLVLITQQVEHPLELEAVRQSIKKLFATGRFADIKAEGSLTNDGEVTLSFVTAANSFVGRITVEGVPKRPTASQVVNASKLSLGSLYTHEKLTRALKNIQQLMETNGFYRSSTTAEEKPHPETQQTDVTFRIQSGPQARVGKVVVTGNLVRNQEQFEDVAKMHSGDLVSVQRVSDALDRLHKKYQKQNRWLAQISIADRTYRPETNVVDYHFIVERGPVVNVVAEGFKLSRGVIKRNVPVYEENAVDDDLLNEGRRNLLNHMQSLGYYNAKVTLEKRTGPEGSVLIVYNIDAGAHFKLVKVLIAGNKYFSEDLLRTRLQIQPADRFVYPHGRYSQGLLASDVSSLEDLYRSSGFRDVKIATHVEADYRGVENQLAVVLQVDEGPQTLVEALTVTGNQAIPLSSFPSLNIGGGEPFSESNISADREILLNYYFNLGFPNATFEASAKPAEGKANRMDVTYLIYEGDRVFVDQVLIAGLVHTRSYVVQRELEVNGGDPLSQVGILKTQQNLYDLGIFSQVDTAVQNPDGSEPTKNVLVSLQEAKRYTFTYGAGFEFQTGQPTVGANQPLGETGVSPLVSFEVTRLNFLGRDRTVSFKANVGRLQQRGLIGYSAPRLWGNPKWRLSLTTFYDNTVDVTTFTSQRLEGTIQAEQTISKSSVMDYRFTFRRVKASEIQISQNLIPLLSQPVRVGGPGITYIRNKRDNDLESTKGSYNTVDASVAAGAFGSEADFSRVLIQNSTYYAFGKKRQSDKKFVLARSTRVGVQNTFGGTITLQPGQTCPDPAQTTCPGVTLVPLAERFLSGGGNSQRGFGLNQAGPRDPQTGYPLGGSGLFLNNVELRFPPPTLPYVQDNLSFALFEDAGNVFTDGRTMLDNLLRWRQKNPGICGQENTAKNCDYSYVSHAIGVGVRYKTPVGPVRFDFGYNLNPPAFPSCQTTAATTVPGYCPQGTYFVPQQASHFNVFFSIGQSF